jgi:ribosomal protein S18 acetylase RimI-like enzyme
MDQAVHRARERSLPGVMLETQSMNVAACQMYVSCGFAVSLYSGIEPDTRGIALFCYPLL